MTIQEFLKDYYCISNIIQDNTCITIESQIIKKSNQTIIYSEISKIYNQYVSDYIVNSHLTIDAIPQIKEKLIDQGKRIHVDVFAQRMSIDDFFPRNMSVDISNIFAS